MTMPNKDITEGIKVRLYLSDGRIIETSNAIQRYRWLIDDELQLAHRRPEHPVPIYTWRRGDEGPERVDSIYAYDAETLDGSFDPYFVNTESLAIIDDSKREDWQPSTNWMRDWPLVQNFLAALFVIFGCFIIWQSHTDGADIQSRMMDVIERKEFRESGLNTQPVVVEAAPEEDWLEPTATPAPAQPVRRAAGGNP